MKLAVQSLLGFLVAVDGCIGSCVCSCNSRISARNSVPVLTSTEIRCVARAKQYSRAGLPSKPHWE